MNSTSPRSNSFTRRQFVKTAALAAGALTFSFPAIVRGRNLNGKINIAGIGVGGKGKSDVDFCAGENIVALCDVDFNYAKDTANRYPEAKKFADFRRMFDEMGKSIDAVIVATPDHSHALIAGTAIKLKKHVYCQKPLTQTIYEARYLRDLANKNKVITQMGNQGSSADGLRRGVECVQAGIIGPVRQAHVWSNRPIWPQGKDRPEGDDTVPSSLDWNQWIGPAPMRPFKSGVYHPFNWRGWQDFGTGALGDMACHTVNLPFRAMQLGYPTEVEATSMSPMNKEMYPLGSKIRFEFPAREKGLQPATFFWYDGGKPDSRGRGGHDGSSKPPREVTTAVEALMNNVPGSGCLMIGDHGQIFSPDDYGTRFFVKLNDDAEFIRADSHPAVAKIPQTIPRNPYQGDPDKKHHLEWLTAIHEDKPEMCYSRFDITAYLTEIMLLGCVAMRVGKKIEWDGKRMRAKNAPEAAQFIKRQNRKGWSV